MKIRDLMRRVPRTCRSEDSLASAGRTMAEAGVGVLPVTDAERRVIGVLTDRDVCCGLSRAAHPHEVRVGEVASSPPWTCLESDAVTTALGTMRQHAVRRLPVVDATGRLEGLLSLDEIVLAAHLVAGGGLDTPVYAEVVETLKAIVRPPSALIEHAAAGVGLR